MDILIVGLGNPGETYANNRHNVGFMFADYMLNKITSHSPLPASHFHHDKYTDSKTAKINFITRNSKLETLLAKPQTFMNQSGIAVKKIVTNYELESYELSNAKSSSISNRETLDLQTRNLKLFIAHDDLDLKLGEYKISKGKGPKMHNGIGSIEKHLGTKEFWRVRIGIDNRQGVPISGKNYVLSNFTTDEIESVSETFPLIFSELQKVITSHKLP